MRYIVEIDNNSGVAIIADSRREAICKAYPLAKGDSITFIGYDDRIDQFWRYNFYTDGGTNCHEAIVRERD